MAAEQRRQWCFVCRQFFNSYRQHTLTQTHRAKASEAIRRMENRNLDTPNTNREKRQ